MAKNEIIKWQPPDILEKFNNYSINVRKPIGEAMKRGFDLTSRLASNNMKTHTGRGSKSLMGEGTHTLNKMYGLTGFRVGSHDIGVNIQEWGRGANKKAPPVRRIQDWMGGSRAEAFAIAKIIGRKGIKPSKPVLKAKREAIPQVIDMVQDAMPSILERLGLK